MELLESEDLVFWVMVSQSVYKYETWATEKQRRQAKRK